MSPLTFLAAFLLLVTILYLTLRRRSIVKSPPPVQRHIRRPLSRADDVSGESSSANQPVPEGAAESSSGPGKALVSTLGWRPKSRSEIEVETIWRLEHTLRDLPDVEQAPIPRIDYEMEPREIALVLSSNPFYAAKILKTVNSAAFGLRQHIDSLQRAITFLGYNQVKNIILQHIVRANLQQVSTGRDLIDMLKFWKHSHAVSICAEYLLRDVLKQTRNRGLITTAALLHDIGWVVYAYYDRETAAGLFGRLAAIPDSGNPVLLEEEAFGFNHLAAGRLLAEHWKIPGLICELIGNHHCATFGLESGLNPEITYGACVLAKAEQMAWEAGYANPLAEPQGWQADISAVLGPKAEEARGSALKLREELDRTMKFIEAFGREE